MTDRPTDQQPDMKSGQGSCTFNNMSQRPGDTEPCCRCDRRTWVVRENVRMTGKRSVVVEIQIFDLKGHIVSQFLFQYFQFTRRLIRNSIF